MSMLLRRLSSTSDVSKENLNDPYNAEKQENQVLRDANAALATNVRK